MTRLPDDPGLAVPLAATPPVDTAELHDAIQFVEKQGKNRQGYVGVGFGCFWPMLGLLILFLGVIYKMYQFAVQSGDQQMIQAFPFPPPYQLSLLIMLVFGVIIGICFHHIARQTRDVERYEIRERLERSSIAEDLQNRRLEFTRILTQTKGPSCLWWLGPHVKATTQTEKKLSILAENLHIYLRYPPRSILSDQNRWKTWDHAAWISLIILITVWAITGWGGIVYVQLAVLAYVAAGPLKAVPWSQLEAVHCQELARYLRSELGLSPDA